MVVIIAAGPFTLRKGRRHSRSISTPMAPEATMVTANATSSTIDQRQPGQDHVLTGQPEHLQHPHGDEASRP